MRGLWLILALLGAAGLARLSTVEPPSTPLSAPAESFSSARAMADVRVIAARPHPLGSSENRQVRDYLTARMRSLGLEPRVQRDTALGVENIIGVLPGSNRAAPALALMAHYDSAPGSPGSTSQPVSPSTTTSGMPPTRLNQFVHPSRQADPQVVDVIRAMDRDLGKAVLVAQLKETSTRPSLAPRLAELEIPVLLVGADSDPFAPWETIERMAALIPGAKAVLANNAGHMVPLEQPDWLAQQIVEFHAG